MVGPRRVSRRRSSRRSNGIPTSRQINKINRDLDCQTQAKPSQWRQLDQAGLAERKKMLKTWVPKDATELRVMNALAQMRADSKRERRG